MPGQVKTKTAPIITYGDPRLRTVCRPVTVFHKNLQGKIDLVAASLYAHDNGAALAAPQIALLKRIVVIDCLDEYYELVNPEIVDADGGETDEEGCLSVPGYTGRVKRYAQLKVRYQDRNGNTRIAEPDGWMARCFQHEMDHLDGILYIDRITDGILHNTATDEDEPLAPHLEKAGPAPDGVPDQKSRTAEGDTEGDTEGESG